MQSLSSAFHSANNSKQSRRGASCQLSSLVSALIISIVLLHRSSPALLSQFLQGECSIPLPLMSWSGQRMRARERLLCSWDAVR